MEQKREEATKILKRGGGGQAKSRNVCLKNGGVLEPPYKLCLVQNPSWGNLQKMVYLKKSSARFSIIIDFWFKPIE